MTERKQGGEPEVNNPVYTKRRKDIYAIRNTRLLPSSRHIQSKSKNKVSDAYPLVDGIIDLFRIFFDHLVIQEYYASVNKCFAQMSAWLLVHLWLIH